MIYKSWFINACVGCNNFRKKDAKDTYQNITKTHLFEE